MKYVSNKGILSLNVIFLKRQKRVSVNVVGNKIKNLIIHIAIG